MKRNIRREDIIIDAFLDCINNEFLITRRKSKESGETIFNPHYFEQGKFVSLDYIDRYNNIVYRIMTFITMDIVYNSVTIIGRIRAHDTRSIREWRINK